LIFHFLKSVFPSVSSDTRDMEPEGWTARREDLIIWSDWGIQAELVKTTSIQLGTV